MEIYQRPYFDFSAFVSLRGVARVFTFIFVSLCTRRKTWKRSRRETV